jgi:FixJ family two-component response regulator
MSGLEVQRNLTEMEGHLPVIFMSGYGDVETSVSAMRAGAANFLTKPVEAETLLANVRGAIEQSRTLLAKFQQQESVRSRRALLTPRETDVLNEIVTGRSNKQVARLLGISPKTVELHRANVMHKMHADSLAELVRLHLTAAGDIAQANSNESLQQADAGD